MSGVVVFPGVRGAAYDWGAASGIGPKTEMQDYHGVLDHSKGSLFMVCDGHGKDGTLVAQSVCDFYVRFFKQIVEQESGLPQPLVMHAICSWVCAQVERELVSMWQKGRLNTSGGRYHDGCASR